MIDWLKRYFSVHLRLLAALARVIRASRQRVKALLTKRLPVLISRALVGLTAIAWLLVALLGDGRQGERLDQWLRDLRQATGFESEEIESPAPASSPER